MADLFQHPTVQALAWTLLHFLWQGAAIAIIASVLMKATAGSTSRYTIGVVALFATLVAPLGTFLVLSANPVAVDALNVAAAVGAPIAVELGAVADDMAASLSTLSTLLGTVVLMWLAGVVFFGLRLTGGWLVARRVTRQAVKPAAAAVQQVAALVAERIGLQRAITVLESSVVAVPVLVGWLKPVIILPTAALSALSPDQVEALIAHELAHVRRHDFLVNLLQSIVEAVLFYHPAVWWLSRRVRAERELCCDDVAVGVCDRLVYATALKDLASMASPRLALAATDGDLLSRIRRVLGHGDVPESGSARWLPLLLAAIVIGLVVPVGFVVAAPQSGIGSTIARVEVAPEAAQAIEVAPEPQNQTSRQTEEIRREVEKLLREIEDRLRQVKSPDDLARMREQIERQLSGADEARALLARRGREEEIEQARRAIESARMQGERGRVEELELARRAIEQAREQGVRGQTEEAQRARRAIEQAREQALRRQTDEAARVMRSLEAVRERDDRSRVQSAEVLRDIEARRTGNQRELDALKAQLDRSLALKERGLMNENQYKELANRYEEMLRSKEQGLLQQDIQRRFAETMKEAAAENRARQQDIERRAAGELRAVNPTREMLDRMIVNRQPVNGPVQAGDFLRVTISNEPEFPTGYQVRTDGTIRIPLLGSVKVLGQTSQQIQTAIGKLLSDRRLGSANQVNVAVFRTGRK